jgi:hypothetical protein
VSIVELAKAVQQCIQQQIDIIKEHSAGLSRYHLTSRAKASLLKGASNSPHKAALLSLASWGFDLWKKVSCESHCYSKEITEEEHDGENIYFVFRSSSQSSLPRKVTKSGSKRCNCEFRIAFNIQCPHETCVGDDNFMPHLWAPRWLQRHQVSSCNNTGEIVQFQLQHSFLGQPHPEPMKLPTPSSPTMTQGSQQEGCGIQLASSPDTTMSSPIMSIMGSQAVCPSRSAVVNGKDWVQQ